MVPLASRSHVATIFAAEPASPLLWRTVGAEMSHSDRLAKLLRVVASNTSDEF